MTWLVAAFSLTATWPNFQKARGCFLIWFCTISAWAVFDALHGLPAQAILVGVYAALAVSGWFVWGRRSTH